MHVQVLRAWSHHVETRAVVVPSDACVGDALAMAGWQLDAAFVGLSVFGMAADATTRLHPGDRIELLRPLQIDPKPARRLRAQRGNRR